ncbi:MAG TPA: DUF2390 domain-containing protein, partial [Stellaceae bacterium]|nr:DUF2390 domain-containing protein [Stellaceae bacterium]
TVDRRVVLPLRDLRRRLKSDPDPDIQALRRRLSALELAAERRIQARLAASAAGRAGKASRLAFAEANLRMNLDADYDSPEAAVLRQALAGL